MSVAARRLGPVEKRAPWIAGGLVLQAAGAGGATAYVLVKAKHEGVGGSFTRATIRLAWHQSVHARTGLAILIACAAVFAAGSILLARPYVHDPFTLLLAIPAAAVVGLVVLGAAALVIGLIIMIGAATGGDDMPWTNDFGSSSSSRRRRRSSEENQS